MNKTSLALLISAGLIGSSALKAARSVKDLMPQPKVETIQLEEFDDEADKMVMRSIKVLNIEGKNLESLDGLQEIDGINEVNWLLFDGNKVSDMANVLKNVTGMSKLERIPLSDDNPCFKKIIEEQDIEGLKKLLKDLKTATGSAKINEWSLIG